ncbi:Cap-specific mRNA (nucleoside-2'-O-)-methyltransferase 2 [Holothuria leucospilota]|uniref:Cap-specific mRNA (nucleoside-2'-O-)-methyltransferase 2 n=1 Tax=Holothuria leucospilota TaxID=206669 RepID=A0A9Q1HAB9_HOLLE|nr:Cap-specific mRNA (nucleoside-2'-O-)-methyltransferase 2 [Holothuria leucospilota]
MDADSHDWREVKKRKRNPSSTCQVDQKVRFLYEKTHRFKRQEDWILLNPELIFCQQNLSSKNLQELKEELNHVKGQLSDMDISKWHKHTSATHRGTIILNSSRWKNRQRFELKTQAWFKFHELLQEFRLVPEFQTFSSVHLCEAPGAFIASLNHFLKQNKEFKNHRWKWLASTLNPYYEGNTSHETIVDDRLIQHTTDGWYFGVDNTGDLMQGENLKGLKQRIAEEFGEVQLVTADGSFNCQDNPAEQENLVHPLHLTETITAISILSKGGSFVLKMFTFFEVNTACLVYLLCCIFDEVHVKKPVTSKAGNSEVYVVCLGFQGICSNLLDKLEEYYGQVMFPPSSLPMSFWNQLLDCACKFKEYQVDTIRENMSLFENKDDERWDEIAEVQKACALQFFDKCHPIPMNQWICKEGSFKQTLNLSFGKLQGSWNERQLDKDLPQDEFVKRMAERLEITKWEEERLCTIVKVAGESRKQDLTRWDFVEGKPLKSVKLSMFCNGDVLEDWNTICERSKVFRYKEKSFNPKSEEFCCQQLGLEEISHWPFHGMKIHLKSNGISPHQEVANPVNITDVSRLLVDEDFTQRLITEYSSKAEYIIADCCCRTDFISSPSTWELQSRHLLLAVVYLAVNVTLQHSCNLQSHMTPVKVECKRYSALFQVNISRVLERLFKKCVNASSSDKFEILETVPVVYLLDPEFQTSLTKFNNLVLRSKACSVIMAELNMKTEENSVNNQ